MRVFGKGNIMAAWKKQLIGNIQVFIVIKKKELLTLLRKPQKHSKEITMVNEHKNVGVRKITSTYVLNKSHYSIRQFRQAYIVI